MSQLTNKIPLSQSPRSGTRICVTISANDDQNSLDLSACDMARIEYVHVINSQLAVRYRAHNCESLLYYMLSANSCK